MKTRVKTAVYMGVLAVPPLLAVYLFLALIWSVMDSRALSCVILALALVACILAEFAVARCWRGADGLFAFQAILTYGRFRKEGTEPARLCGEERMLKYMRGIPGLEERADAKTAAALYMWGEELAGRKGR